MFCRFFSCLLALSVCAPIGAQEVAFPVPSALDVRIALLQWIAQTKADETTRRSVLDVWADDAAIARWSGEEMLDRLIEAFAAVDPATKRLREASSGSGPLEAIVFDGLRDNPMYRSNVSLFRARWLTQHRFYDEAYGVFQGLSPEDVVDPAGLFFYRAVCQRHLLLRKEAADSLSLLLEHTEEVPDRFLTVAEILLKELGAQKEDDLGHVSRLMSDVHRRLDLGRSGERVQEQQEKVIAAIDRLVEEAENKQQQQNQQNSQGGGGQSTPGGGSADDARIQGSKGAGEADRKNLKGTGDWGMLDRGTEAKVRELIRQQFPASYLDIISEYSRRIAEQE